MLRATLPTLVACWVATSPGGYVYGASPSRSAGSDALAHIRNEVLSAYNRHAHPVVVFDVDGTLLDTRPRTVAILQEYAQQELKRVRPEAAAKLSTMTADSVRYRLPDTLTGLGVTESGIQTNAAVYWAARYYDSAYLRHDVPIPGAVDYVRSLYAAGAKIVYVSSRDAPRQFLGTSEALFRYGFPVGTRGTELIMKPRAEAPDGVFKQDTTTYLRHSGHVVATFDNEPANANVFSRAFEGSVSVLLQGPHRPNPPPLLGTVVRVSSFAPSSAAAEAGPGTT